MALGKTPRLLHKPLTTVEGERPRDSTRTAQTTQGKADAEQKSRVENIWLTDLPKLRGLPTLAEFHLQWPGTSGAVQDLCLA